MKYVLLFVVASTLLVSLGCAPQLQNAVKVGGPEPATWVFVSVADRSYQGIYRCKETNEGPVCQKAKID